MSIFSSMFGNAAQSNSVTYGQQSVQNNIVTQQMLRDQTRATYEEMLRQQYAMNAYEIPLAGPKQSELDKYPGLQDAWSQWMTIYHLHK